MKILVATVKPFAPAAVQGIKKMVEEAGHEFALLEKYRDKQELLDAVADANAIICRSDKITAEVLNAAKKLKIVVRAGAGYDNIDLETATKNGVVVMNTPGQNANAVAELTIAMMIFISRNCFTPGSGREIMGKTLGICAYGHIGKLVALKAKALGMNVIADSSKTADVLAADGVKKAASRKEVFKCADYVSLHFPENESTKKSVGYDLITSMPEKACLINTARAGIIDEEGLEKALGEREDIKYITDIAPSNYEELRKKFGTRIFAPMPKKIGAQTGEANMNAGYAAARQIICYFKDGDTTFRVNK